MTAQPTPDATGSEGDAAPGATPEDPVAQPVSLPLAGLYGVEKLMPTVNGHTVTFAAGGSCAEVLSLIGAGQWSATVLTTPDDFAGPAGDLAPWYIVTLAKGTQHAYLRLTEGTYTCDAALIPESAETVTAAGALAASGPAAFQPFQCGPNIFDRESMQLIGFYEVPGGRQLMVALDLPAFAGDGTIEHSGSDPVVTVLPEGASGLETMVSGIAQGLTTGDEAEIPGSQEFAVTDESTAEVTIASLYPLQGEFRLAGLADDSGATLDMAASFYCDTTAIPEDSDGGDDSDDSDGGAAGDQGTITAEVDSGPLQGTYTASGKLTCDYGFTAPHAWWLYFTAMDENGDLPADPAPTDLAIMQWWSVPPEEVSAPGVLFSDPAILDLGFGEFVLNRAQQLHVNSDVGGSGGPTERDGNTVSFTATTAEGPSVTVTARCPVIDES